MDITMILGIPPLLTQELVDNLPQCGSGALTVLAKFQAPADEGSWYVTEASVWERIGMPVRSLKAYCDEFSIDAEELELRVRQGQTDVLFTGVQKLDEWKLGYFRLSQLASYRGPLGLPIVRDDSWEPVGMNELLVQER